MLDGKQKQKIVDFLNEKAPRVGSCPECGSQKMTLGDHVVQPMNASAGGVSIGGPSYPQIMIVCENCGHTKYFNAVVIGILDEGGKDG